MLKQFSIKIGRNVLISTITIKTLIYNCLKLKMIANKKVKTIDNSNLPSIIIKLFKNIPSIIIKK